MNSLEASESTNTHRERLIAKAAGILIVQHIISRSHRLYFLCLLFHYNLTGTSGTPKSWRFTVTHPVTYLLCGILLTCSYWGLQLTAITHGTDFRGNSKVLFYTGGNCPHVPAAVLILAELHDVAGDVSELQVGIAVVPEVLEQAAPAWWHHVRHAVT